LRMFRDELVFAISKRDTIPLVFGGKMGETVVKVDSKGRICIPPEFREELGGMIILRKTRKGILLSPGEDRDFMDEFRKVMLSEPRRTGIPENPPARKMKSIRKETP